MIVQIRAMNIIVAMSEALEKLYGVGSKFIILLACGVQKDPLSLTATHLVRATLTR